MNQKYIIAGTFDLSSPERPHWWVSKIVESYFEETVAECYGSTQAEAEARAELCAKALNESEVA